MPNPRPYARDPNSPPSVTQVIGCLDKPGLSWGAASETAKYAAYHVNDWIDLPAPDAVRKLYRHHRGVWDHRALIGSALHTINAEWCGGNTVRAIDVVQDLRAKSSLWQRTPESDILDELLPMARGLSKWWRDAKPEPLSWEQVVRYQVPNKDLTYVGTLDWRAMIKGQAYLLDLKTTGTARGKGKYWDQWRLQLAAYRYATEAVAYDEADQEQGQAELPEVDATAVVHVYKDGHVDWEPLRAGPREHEIFLALRRVYGWRHADGQNQGATGLEDVS